MQYTEEEVAHNTSRQVHMHAKTMEAAKEAEEQAKNTKYREDIWEMKQTFLNMDVVKRDTNKDLRRKIRKSRTVIEAQAYGIACILRDDEQFGK
jgi:flagellar biosynthesis component FlhA